MTTETHDSQQREGAGALPKENVALKDEAVISVHTKLDDYVKIMVSLRECARPILCW